MDAGALCDRFHALLSEAVTLYDDALPVLTALSGRFSLGIASNALSRYQRARVAALGIPMDRVFLSEEMGCVKPAPAFFLRAAQTAGVPPQDCLMVGDSLTSDIAGAVGAGMRACWLNRTGRPLDGSCAPDYTIDSLWELLNLDIIKEEICHDRL
jgi:2-haloacid dehalogenase